MFNKILIANRGDGRSEAEAAVQGHVGMADVSRNQNAWRAKRAAIETRA